MTPIDRHRNKILLCLCLFVMFLQESRAAQSTGWTARVEDDGAGSSQLRIENRSNIPISAFALTVDTSDSTRASEYRFYYDALLDTRDWVVAPGDHVLVPLPRRDGQFVGEDKLSIKAVLFVDGSASGDQRWINMMRLRRGRMLARLAEIHEILSGGSDMSSLKTISRLRAHEHKLLGEPVSVNDELKILDEAAINSAIKTFEAAGVDAISYESFPQLRASYMDVLERRLRTLKRSGADRDAEDAISVSATEMIPEVGFVSGGARAGVDSPNTFASSNSQCYIDKWKDNIVLQLNNCGPSNKWDLAIQLGLYDPTTGNRTYTTYDDGQQDAYGVCWGGYYDCTAAYQQGGQKAGMVSRKTSPSNNGTQTLFYWLLDDWSSPTFGTCPGCGNSGQTFVAPVNNQNTSGDSLFPKHQLAMRRSVTRD